MLVNTAVFNVSPCPLIPCLCSVRHIKAPHRTTVRLENYFWQQIEMVAKNCGMSWRQWAETTLTAKPLGANSASWLRLNCLQSAIQSHPQAVIELHQPKESHG